MSAELREVAVRGGWRLVCDGWAYYSNRRGHNRMLFLGYYERDTDAIRAWVRSLQEDGRPARGPR